MHARFFAAVIFLFLSPQLFAQFEAPTGGAPMQSGASPSSLSREVEQIAADVGIKPELDRARFMMTQRGNASMSVEELALRQQISEAVVMAALDVDAVSAEIDNERAQILEIRASLSSARDKKVNLLTFGNIVATGLGVVGTAMQFSNRTAIAGDWVGVAGGTAGTVFSMLALRQGGGKESLGVAPNMLAPILGRRPELRSLYPDDVWKYLNEAPANDPRVRVPWRQQLISDWVRLGRIGPPDAPESQPKIDLITSRIGDQKKLSIDVLSDRLAMLNDLQARVLLMKQGLRDLMGSLRK